MKATMRTTTLPSPSLLCCNRKKEGDDSIVAIAFFCYAAITQKQDGDGSVTTITFFVVLQQKKGRR
jgi:hypothetical protein